MIEITREIYAAVAERLKTALGESRYFNGTVEFEIEEFRSVLKITVIVYHRTESLPEGVFCRIADIVPVWWEFSTVRECGAVLNDFSFSELKNYIIEPE